MEKIVEQGLLYDFYGELLTEHQQQIYEGVVYDNLSLGEIAQEQGVSRQAVHDIIKRCDKLLQGYEEKLQLVSKFTRIKEKISQINQLSQEEDVKVALKEVKMALLEADVNFKVVKQFVKAVEERAIGADVLNGLNPGQMVIKIVNEEMVSLMGSETTEITLQPGKAITVIMMCGLQGAGKTTTTAKIAGKLKLKGKKPLLAACDVYRPAAI